jgi:DedD protein
MRNFNKYGMMVAACLLLALALGGCARQHIVSSPPAQRPADRATPRAAEPAPAPEPAPTADPERTRVDEGVYVVDAPATEDPARQVREVELGEEPLAEEPADGALPAAAPKPAPKPAMETTTEAPPDTEPDAAAATHAPLGGEAQPGATASAMPEVVEGGKYYVQVGAFSDLENANRALARLIADGYKGSKLDATDDGLFRVQAGAFADHDSAELALSRLRADYPKGFVLKTD